MTELDPVIRDAIRQFNNGIAFNRLMGIRLTDIEPDKVHLEFDMTPELIGNPYHKILHGGAISSVLDLAGGLMAMLSILDGETIHSFEDVLPLIRNLGTIDLRVDYLRPGAGETFYATGFILRKGNKIAVTRMELHNEKENLIAVATGTYLVG